MYYLLKLLKNNMVLYIDSFHLDCLERISVLEKSINEVEILNLECALTIKNIFNIEIVNQVDPLSLKKNEYF